MIFSQKLRINCQLTARKIRNFIKNNINKSGLKGAIVSVSGGIDSAVTLHLTTQALSPEKVTVVTMPESDITPKKDIEDVMQHCKQLNLTCDIVEITPILHVIQETLPNYDINHRISHGNLRARLRMMINYHYANIENKMVMGTSNKTELLTGFFTKYGDGGVDLIPLGDLYKTQLRQLAEYLEIPHSIIHKPPSPGFFAGQTDEKELGINYQTLDLILYGFEKGYTIVEISNELDISDKEVEIIINRVKANEHKRRFPLILRLS